LTKKTVKNKKHIIKLCIQYSFNYIKAYIQITFKLPQLKNKDFQIKEKGKENSSEKRSKLKNKTTLKLIDGLKCTRQTKH
jgi:hypothetical protein